VAHFPTKNLSDQDGLLPLTDATSIKAGHLPDEVSADKGFYLEADLADFVERSVRDYAAIAGAKRPLKVRRAAFRARSRHAEGLGITVNAAAINCASTLSRPWPVRSRGVSQGVVQERWVSRPP